MNWLIFLLTINYCRRVLDGYFIDKHLFLSLYPLLLLEIDQNPNNLSLSHTHAHMHPRFALVKQLIKSQRGSRDTTRVVHDLPKADAAE